MSTLSRLRGDRGSAVVEFALVTPLLLLVALAVLAAASLAALAQQPAEQDAQAAGLPGHQPHFHLAQLQTRFEMLHGGAQFPQ